MVFADCIKAFGVLSSPPRATASEPASAHSQQAAAAVSWCSCRCYGPSELRLREALKSRRPPVKCSAWGRKRNRPASPEEGKDSKPSSDPAASTTGKEDSHAIGPADPRSAGGAMIDDVDKIEAAAATLRHQAGTTKRQQQPRGAAWEDWEDWDPDWEGPPDDQAPPDQFRRVNPRRGMGTKTPRDEYLRPMIDTLGIQYRLGFKQLEAEERVASEFETNQWESREAVKFSGMQYLLHGTQHQNRSSVPIIDMLYFALGHIMLSNKTFRDHAYAWIAPCLHALVFV